MDYRLITKKSAEQLRQEGLDTDYFGYAEPTDALIVRGEGISYSEAFDRLMKKLKLEEWKYNSGLEPDERREIFGLCDIRQIKDRLAIILEGKITSMLLT